MAANLPSVTVRDVGAFLRLGLLGPLEVRSSSGGEPPGGSEPLALGGTRQRALIAVLALHLGQVLSKDRLVDELWGERPPATAVHTVEVFVSRLRRALGPAGGCLRTRPPGYALELDPEDIDATRCERLYQRARSALIAGNAESAVVQLREAEELWRGPPLVEFSYEPFAQAAIARLEELRVSCREELIEAQLALGHHAEVIPDLEAFIREHPFRERPYGQLMLALYRCGRQSDALETYQHARRTLIDELGVEPGPALRDLVGLILEQDATLEPERGVAVATTLEGPETNLTSRGLHADDPGSADTAATQPDRATEPLELSRRTATIVAVRLSTADDVDPEHARAVVAAAGDVLDETVRRYGGAVVSGAARGELFGVFGFPRTLEDDALCALRAADDFRVRIASDESPDAAKVVARIGVYTGEVVGAGLGDLYGSPVERALTLASAAAEGEVLVSDATRGVVGEAAAAEMVNDGTWRLLHIAAQPPALERVDKTPMFGRERELADALDVFARAADEGSAQLLTIVGDAGIGKSRFAHELVGRVEDAATVLAGRCLHYGEGVTYWPLREAITTLAGGETKQAIDALFSGVPDGAVLADITAACLGLTSGETNSEQVPWAIRRLLEELASEGPLLLVIEDAHWAQDPLLDIVDHLVDRLAAPVMVLCLARPELFDVRPRWRGGQERVRSIVLQPLPDGQAERLVEASLGGRELSAATRARILEAAEGNPLFVEQLLAIADDDPSIRLDAELPATIQRVLASRIDLLGPAERAFVMRAALIGREFPFPAVVALLPPEARPSADEHLRSLVRRGLIKPDRSSLAGEEQLRFHHILIQDVAYRSTPKALRGELHERFADWLAPRETRTTSSSAITSSGRFAREPSSAKSTIRPGRLPSERVRASQQRVTARSRAVSRSPRLACSGARPRCSMPAANLVPKHDSTSAWRCASAASCVRPSAYLPRRLRWPVTTECPFSWHGARSKSRPFERWSIRPFASNTPRRPRKGHSRCSKPPATKQGAPVRSRRSPRHIGCVATSKTWIGSSSERSCMQKAPADESARVCCVASCGRSSWARGRWMRQSNAAAWCSTQAMATSR